MEEREGIKVMRHENEVNDILNEFLTAFETLDEDALVQYLNEYPDLADSLHEHAGMMRMFTLVPEAELSQEEESRQDLRTASVVQNVLYQMNSRPALKTDGAASEPIASIKDELEAKGYTYKSAAAAAGVSDLILNKFDKRTILPESIPRSFYEMVAGLIKRAVEEVHSYARQPTAVGGGHYKASSAPIISKQADFFELVKWDPDMDDAAKLYWLSQTPLDKNL